MTTHQYPTFRNAIRNATLAMRPKPRITVKRNRLTNGCKTRVWVWQWKCTGPCEAEWCGRWNGWYSSPSIAADRGRIHLRINSSHVRRITD